LKQIEEQVAVRPNQRGLDVIVETGMLTGDKVCEGKGYSPRITIGNLKTPFLAVTLEEVATSSNTDVHWLLWNVEKAESIPRNLPKLAELDRPIRGRQGRNSLGEVGYTAPCPPRGAKRSYRFRAYGLAEELELEGGSTGRDLDRAMEGKILQYGEAVVDYERPMSGNVQGRAP
jgi:Raf kinase inhibitor-like YbhB/YbcL family protein